MSKAARCWGIKLGSGGRCVQFCKRHQIVGVGWSSVDTSVLATSSWGDLSQHVKTTCLWYKTDRERGNATGQLFRFARECAIGDYILYYDPPQKSVQICRVISEPFRREFEPDSSDDIWQCRKVEYPIKPIPVLDFYGALKGSLLGPRMSFWEIRGAFEIVDRLAHGEPPGSVSDPELEAAYQHLSELVLKRVEILNEQDWEWLVVDYFKAQGAHVDERRVGGSGAIIDAEARFGHGELGEEIWRIQVKRWQNQKIDWPTIHKDLEKVGDARFCFVSVYGFTDEAQMKAEEEDVRLMEASDFTRFLLSERLRARIRTKLQVPVLGSSATAK